MRKAWNHITYTEGQLICGYKFIRELDRRVDSKGGVCRVAVFECSECGKEFSCRIKAIKSGNTKSCGCLKKLNTGAPPKHGMHLHPLYNKWHHIKSRCYYPKDDSYEWYGARGIKVCDEWKDDFQTFYDHVTRLDNYGEEGFTLDREDNDGDYEPGNVRWVDGHTQAVNSRNVLEKKEGGSSDYVGVFKFQGKFSSIITVRGKLIKIGRSITQEDAVMDRDMYIIKNGLWEYPLQVIKTN